MPKARDTEASRAFAAVTALDQPWADQLDADPRSGRRRGHPWNIAHVLRAHPDWRGVLAYDQFAHAVVMRRPPPLAIAAAKKKYPRGGYEVPIEWTDDTMAHFLHWLSDPRVGITTTEADARRGLLVVSQEQAYHPVRDYLDALEWDGVARLGTMLSDLFGALQDEYSERVGINWMVSCVARIYAPGCQVDTMPVLEGLQGAGKTQAMRVLGGRWYAEPTAAVGTKDFLGGLRGTWIQEVAELEAFSKAEASTIKRMLTAREDRFRPPYGRADENFPRTCVFVGTTNEDAYLRDSTGARRFWPLRCGELALDALRANRDQLWAEAVHVYRHGGDPALWPDDVGRWRWWSVPASARDIQDERYQVDPWEPAIVDWLEGRAGDAYYEAGHAGPIQAARIDQVLRLGVRKRLEDISRQDMMRAGDVLRHLGWTRQRRRDAAGTRAYVYIRPAGARVDGSPS